MELSGKVAVVTGGSEGLGLAIVKKLLNKGCIVHIFSRDPEKHLAAQAKLNNSNVFFTSVDVANYEQIQQAIQKIGNVDILINNAGIFLDGPLDTVAPQAISNAIDTNLKGVIYTTRAVLPSMKRRNKGFIINISSTSGLKPRANESVYVASKFGVRGFTDSLKEELKGTGVRVAGFYPGGMNTRFFEKAGSPKENAKWMDVNAVADVIITILTLNDSMILDHVVLNKRVV